MLHRLRRHPLAVSTSFRHSLVLTYAYPADLLRPVVPPGLTLDTFAGYGFLTIALVQATGLRPTCLPAVLGRDVFLCGYRIFTRRADGGSHRGLRVLHSLSDRRWMCWAGNLLTRYHYRLCRAELIERPGALEWRVASAEASLDVTVRLDDTPADLPEGSPFASPSEARRFAGPLPYTFDYEPETRSLVSIRGVRAGWNPRPVRVAVHSNTFLDRAPFRDAPPLLANAFYVHDLPYRWERGVLIPLEER
jgi:hypothetical protein